MARNHADGSGLSGNGYNAFQELVTTYEIVSDKTISAKTEELAVIKMHPGQDPTTYSQEAGFQRDGNVWETVLPRGDSSRVSSFKG